MAAVMIDRSAYRRLDRQYWQAEDMWREYGRHQRRDRAPCDWPETTPIYQAMRSADPWLESARRDPAEEPAYMRELVAFVRVQQPIVQQFIRRRYVDGYTTEQARTGLNMSAHRANNLLTQLRNYALSL